MKQNEHVVVANGSDWTVRPLSNAQVRYALDDVRYLAQLRDELLRRADSLGTRAWLEEEMTRIHYIQEVQDAAADAFAWLSERAEELHVDAGAIASRATVTAFVDNVDDESNPLAHGWRWEAIGREMADRFGVA